MTSPPPGWNQTRAPLSEATLPQLLSAQVERTPQAVAVVHGEVTLTYRELHDRAGALPARLQAAGVGPEDVVALVLPNSAAFLVAALGVLRAGAVYLPVDPQYPPGRIDFMLTDARAVARVSLVDGNDQLPPGDLPVYGLDLSGESDLAAGGAVFEPPVITPMNAAYVIYTSGSSGRPKGVLVSHRSLVNYLLWAVQAYPSCAGTALVVSPVTFDLTVTALYAPLLSGGQVHLSGAPGTAGRAALRRASCTLLKATPGFVPLLELLTPEFSPTGHLVLGGEGLFAATLTDWRAENPGVTVINEYGPTEATVGCLEHRIEPAQELPAGPVALGRPIWNTRIYLLDGDLRPVPAGAEGEIFIAGAALARGYLGRPALTAERFGPCPFGPPGERMYRTGDLARWAPDGRLLYVGRVDAQVKIGGFRVEIDEVEAALVSHPDVSQGALTVRADTDGNNELVAWVAAVAGRVLDGAAVQTHLALTLPGFMIPGEVVVLESMPLTAHGKIDRTALSRRRSHQQRT